MSKVTTRLANQDIVNIARQQYENQQKSKLPSIVINLPSKGLIYPKSSLLREGKVEIRYMTAYDEDILTNSSYLQSGILFDKLIDAILLTPIKSKDLSPQDRDALIVYSRIASYGSEYPVTVQDPESKKDLSRIVDLNKIGHKPFTLESDDAGEFTYQVNDTTSIKFRYTTTFKDEEFTVSGLMKNMICEINGSRKETDIENFLRYEFLARDAKEFRLFYADNAPGLNYDYEFEGEDGSTFAARFQVGPDFFWF